MKTVLSIPSKVYNKLKNHLLPKMEDVEEAAFVFTSLFKNKNELIFKYKEWFPVKVDEFENRSSFHFELSDEIRAKIIKKAHDLDCSIIEFHSHLGYYPACFSYSDWCGFEEFVPHVLWRLKGKHYVAIVMARSGFDALVWKSKVQNYNFLDELRVGRIRMYPTRLSLPRRRYYEGE